VSDAVGAGDAGPGARPPGPGWFRLYRQQIFFIGGFLLSILAFAVVLNFEAVTLHITNPYTGWIARASGAILSLFGEQTTVRGTLLSSPRFSVNIYHGCNGVLATSIYLSAVLGFPSTLKEKALGFAVGIPAIQIINMVRILSLYYIGIYWPKFFELAHGYVWQSVVILLSMVVWIFWAERFVQVPARTTD
jgi:exosortase H (IPTLxxWG-CTERM-specific)